MTSDAGYVAASVGAALHHLLDPRATGSVAQRGVVVGTFSRGCYARAGDTLFAMGEIPAGPIHLVIPGLTSGFAVGDEVVISPRQLNVRGVVIALDQVIRWNPPVVPTDVLGTVLARLGTLPDTAPLDLVGRWPEVVAAVGRGDLGESRRLIEGRGSGSTPTGDDVLAGLLLVDSLVHRQPGDQQRREAIAAAVRSTDLSRAFLRWAAVGQSIEPVHELFDRATDREPDEFLAAADRVRTIGASSGGALLAGIGLGARHSR